MSEKQAGVLPIIGIIYILSTAFPAWLRPENTLYGLQPADFIFLFLVVFLLLKSDFGKFILRESKDTFTTRNGLFSLNGAVLLYVASVGISAAFNCGAEVMKEFIGTLYLATLYLCFKYIFSAFGLSFSDKSIRLLGLAAALTGLSGWMLHTVGIDNPTGLVRDYPYFGRVFRLQGFTPTPAFFYNIVGFVFIYVWTAGRQQFSRFVHYGLLILLGFALILTLSKSLLLTAAIILFYEALKRRKYLKVAGFAAAFFLLFFMQIATHFLFVSCTAAAREESLQDDMYVSNVPIYRSGDFCILETNYLLYKRSALICAARNFPLGVGLGQHTHFLQKLAEEPAYAEKYRGQSGDTHSTYTGMLCETGFLGFVAVVFIFFLLFKNSARLLPSFWWVALFFALEAVNTDIMNFRHFWIFIAAVAAFTVRRQS